MVQNNLLYLSRNATEELVFARLLTDGLRK